MKKLKIVIISTLWERTPPPLYGGTERIVSYITEGLVQRGHDVTLFATGDSKTKAKLISTYPRALYRDKIPWTSSHDTLINIAKACEYAQREKADIIHSHAGYLSFVFANFITVPMIFTIHGNIDPKLIPKEKIRMLLNYKNNNFVTISNSQRKIPDLNYVATVYNGIPLEDYTFNQNSNDYLVWLGRFTPKKGAAEAIRIAKAVGKKLLMAGKIDWAVKEDVEYFNKKIKPDLKKDKIEFIGEINQQQKNQLLKKAKLLLNPISWDEPFGLVPIEANACGTPAIVFNRGAMPELIKDGVNGFLIKPGDTDKMIKIVKMIYEMPEEKYKKFRQACRKHVEKNFTIEKMIDGYEKVYQKVINSYNKNRVKK